MATIKQVYLNVKDVKLMEVALDTVQQYASEIVEINKDQLGEGTRKDGSKIEPSYRSDSYKKMKHKMNARAGLGTPDLKLTGAFQDKMYMKVVNKAKGEFDISSKDKKREELRAKYGGVASRDIFGLSAKGRELLIYFGFEETLCRYFRQACRL